MAESLALVLEMHGHLGTRRKREAALARARATRRQLTLVDIGLPGMKRELVVRCVLTRR